MKKNLYFLVFLLILILIETFSLGKISIYQGDLGRDLYLIQLTSEGNIPHFDFYWIYGPFMLYYYSLFFLLKKNILSIYFGYEILLIFSSIIVFKVFETISQKKILGFLFSVYFLIFQKSFYHTFNHIGGIFIISVLLLIFAKEILENKKIPLYVIPGLLFILSFIKLNVGFSLFIAIFIFLIIIWLFEKKQNFPLRKCKFLCASLLLILSLYGTFIMLTPKSQIHKNFPYSGTRRPDHPLEIKTFVMNLINPFVVVECGNIKSFYILNSWLLEIVILCCIVYFIKVRKEQQNKFILLIFILTIFLSHEYFLTQAIYPLRYWSMLYVLSLVILLGEWLWSILERKNKIFGKIFGVLFVMMISFQIIAWLIIFWFNYKNQQYHYLNLKKGGVYAANKNWCDVVNAVTIYIQNNTAENEKILVIPYEPLYYFLSERKSPVKDIEFLRISGISSDDERDIITSIEKEKVRYILISNYVHSFTEHSGRFGETHCQNLSKFIKKEFQPVITFGNWNGSPFWNMNHSEMIWKRKKVFNP